jgi:hypothetical protein
MCWNPEVSIATFIFGFISCIYLYINDYDKISIAFILSFIFMQLLEFFMWIYLNKKINKFFSILTFIIIFLQPIIVISITKFKYLLPYYIIFMIIIFTICLLFFNLKFNFTPKISKNNHLSWNWTDNKIFLYSFMVIYLIFFGGIFILTKRYMIFLFGLITFLYSYWNINKFFAASSYWCYITNFIIIIMIIDLMIKNKKNNNYCNLQR